MESHIVKILAADFVTHNVRNFVVEKPPGLSFISGQATDISINQPGLESELRPFTFTSVNQSENLEFLIKIYTGHNGVTEKLGELSPGDELIIHEVFGSIQYKGSGLFIAAGAGITPFISIFRQLKLEDQLAGNTLIFANRTTDDIILKDELKAMLDPHYIDVIEESIDGTMPGKVIDRELLKNYVRPGDQYYYICGPDQFTQIMADHLIQLGVPESKIVIEQ